MHAFINRTIITEEKAYIHIKDRGFLLGDGIFETLKVQNGHIEFFDAHYERLKYSAATLFIQFEYEADFLKNICLKLLKKNKLENGIASIRITLTRGIGLRGINFPEKQNSTLLITTAEYHPPESDIYPRAMITNIKRNPLSPITKFKTLNYLEPILARNEAQSNGFDEGIMLNTDGFITECSIANIFFIKDMVVMTPSVESGILPGIMRNHVIKLCHKNNIQIIEKKISVDDALNSDEVFQTNSLIGLQILSQINDKKFSVGDYTLSKKIESILLSSVLCMHDL
ncbi:MAG: aminotransferase class IV [Gammaproteobacteria bacterium]|nr:aminotransferase class IV [Gammaproteobacteria bacterium]